LVSMEDDINSFEFDWEHQVDDELRALETYMFGKVTSVVEHRSLQRHAAEPNAETGELLRRIAARYQRGELGQLIPVLLPFTGGEQKALASEFFATIGEQPDDNVFAMYRLVADWADDLGFLLPKNAPPLDERPMDEIELGEPWPDMQSIAIH